MKKLEINIPNGHEIDLEKSNLSKGIIFFKEVEKVLTYDDIAEKLFKNQKTYFIDTSGDIDWLENGVNVCNEQNNSKTIDQLESILALNKLCNVAKYLNGNWIPIENKNIYYLCLQENAPILVICQSNKQYKYSFVYFKTEQLAKQAIERLGEDEVRKALTLNH